MVDRISDGPFDKVAFAIGLVFAGGGLYFVLASFGVVPLANLGTVNGPIWLVTCVGLVFGLAGVALLIRAVTGADDRHGDLPAGSPYWLHVVYWLVGPGVVVGLAAIGTWIAFGPGERGFEMSVPFITVPANEWLGRVAFGFGAIITWLTAFLMTRTVVRKIFRREKA